MKVTSSIHKSLYLVLCTFLMVSCSGFTEGKPLAEKAVVEFHESFNNGNFDAIYEDASKEFKRSASKEEFINLLDAIHTKLGPQISSNNSGWKINNHNLKTYVVLGQETTFEQGKGFETFTFLVKDQKALLYGYNINSTDLIVK